MKDILSRMTSGEVWLIDGSCGALLLARGGSASSADNNLDNPHLLRQLYRDYLAAGADCITTNTFALNPIYTAHQGQSEERARRSLHAAMEIAMSEAGPETYVLADLGPGGVMLKPLGPGEPEAFMEAYAAQAEIMAEYEPDAFLIETVFDINEAELIARGCKAAAANIPVLASLTFASTKRGGATLMGNKAADIAAAAEAWGCAAAGANCGELTPAEYAIVLASMREACQLPLLIQPNAGKPELRGERVFYPLSPEEFAQQMQECYDAGARGLGGCCGTTPEHIAALAERFK